MEPQHRHPKLLASDEESIDNVIWATSIEELKAALEVRHQRPHKSLTFVKAYITTCDVRVHPQYDGELSMAEIAQTAKEYGEKFAISNFPPDTDTEVFNDHGLYFTGTCDSLFNLVAYDPKRAHKQLHKVEKQRPRHVTVSDIATLLGQFENITCPPFPRPGTYGANTRSAYTAFLMGRVVLFNLLYGKNAHRRFGPWQDFVKIWKEKTNSDKVFSGEGGVCADFAGIMARETKVRLRKPKDIECFARDKQTDLRF